MNTDIKTHILLSTYNGSKYLAEQLDSIFNQTYQNFTLYIRDDASTDSTFSVLKSYMNEHPSYARRIIIVPNNQQHNLGYMESFWLLLDQCGGADYYAFCDQDDVWLPNKLETGITCLEKEDPSIPLLHFSNYNYCDEQLNYLHPAPTIRHPIRFQDVLFYTPAFGFSMLINEQLRSLALQTTNRTQLPHDGWIQKLAASCGKILYTNKCTALYRRHSSAVTASNTQLLSTILYWIKHDIFGSSMKKTHFVINRFYEEYSLYLSPQDFKLLKLYTGHTSTILIWFKRLVYPKKFRPTFGGELALRICFFLNTY